VKDRSERADGTFETKDPLGIPGEWLHAVDLGHSRAETKDVVTPLARFLRHDERRVALLRHPIVVDLPGRTTRSGIPAVSRREGILSGDVPVIVAAIDRVIPAATQ